MVARRGTAGRGRVLTPSPRHGALAVLDPAGRIEHRVGVASAARDASVVR
jgi:hypothetical protein